MSGRDDRSIDDHYTAPDVYALVTTALSSSGIDLDTVTVHDLAPIDQFHTGQRASTDFLAQRLGVGADTVVLDAGCGIGGPARFLATVHGCRVIGVDLAEELIVAARRLNELLGVDDRVSCEVADLTATGLEDESVDTVWSQNVLMNISDKAAALTEFHRVVRSGGLVGVQLFLERGEGEIDYPVFWASGPEMDFPVTEDQFRRDIDESGLTLDELVLAPPFPPPEPLPPGLHPGIVMGIDDISELGANAGRAVESGKLVLAIAILSK